jgi:hypothetical protein
MKPKVVFTSLLLILVSLSVLGQDHNLLIQSRRGKKAVVIRPHKAVTLYTPSDTKYEGKLAIMSPDSFAIDGNILSLDSIAEISAFTHSQHAEAFKPFLPGTLAIAAGTFAFAWSYVTLVNTAQSLIEGCYNMFTFTVFSTVSLAVIGVGVILLVPAFYNLAIPQSYESHKWKFSIVEKPAAKPKKSRR